MEKELLKSGSGKPNIVILGSNFGGLTAARFIREKCKDKVNITVIDRKPYLIFIPNIPLEVFADHNPVDRLHMPFLKFLKDDGTDFLQAEVKAIDVESKKISIIPIERPGAAPDKISYDYLVIALGAKLDYENLPGFAEYGHTLSDSYYGNKLRHYLFDGHYKGGPVAIGTARSNMGKKGRPDWIPDMTSACEGPPLEISLGLSTLFEERKMGTPKNITLFTQGEWIAEDAGVPLVKKFLQMAEGMGMSYMPNTIDIKEIHKDGIEFKNGQSLEAELKIVLPNWASHDFLRDLPIVDEQGFIVTDLNMQNPDYPEIYAVGDCAAITAPKLGGIGDLQARIVAQQLAKVMGTLSQDEKMIEFKPVVMCFGDMGHHKAFYIHSDLIFGGKIGIMKMGHMYYDMKMGFKEDRKSVV